MLRTCIGGRASRCRMRAPDRAEDRLCSASATSAPRRAHDAAGWVRRGRRCLEVGDQLAAGRQVHRHRLGTQVAGTQGPLPAPQPRLPALEASHTTTGWALSRCLCTRHACRWRPAGGRSIAGQEPVEPDVGLEPTTYRLQGGCSTTELIRRRPRTGRPLHDRPPARRPQCASAAALGARVTSPLRPS